MQSSPCRPPSRELKRQAARSLASQNRISERLRACRFLIEFFHRAQKLCSPCPTNRFTFQRFNPFNDLTRPCANSAPLLPIGGITQRSTTTSFRPPHG